MQSSWSKWCASCGRRSQHANDLRSNKIFTKEHGVLFVPGKAANAGGVAVSALEMSQNSERLSWTFEQTDEKLKEIMQKIYQNIKQAAKEYGFEDDFVLELILQASKSCCSDGSTRYLLV